MIIYDNASQTVGGGTSTTLSHEVGSGNGRLLVVGLSAELDTSFSGVTYGGVAMTHIDTIDTPDDNLTTSLWYLLNPAVGTADIVASNSPSIAEVCIGAVSLFGVKPQAPEATDKHSQDSGTSISATLTTLTDKAWIVSAIGAGNTGTFSPASGQTERVDQADNSSALAMGTEEIATAGEVTDTWNTPAGRSGIVSAAFAAGGGGGFFSII